MAKNKLSQVASLVGIAGVLGVAFLSSSVVSAGTATANLAVSATVSANCSITAGTLAFGAYDPVVANASANVDGSGTFSVACTKGATGVSIDLGQGANYSLGRRLAAATNYLTYQLYSDSARSTVWGSTSGGAVVSVSAPSSSAAVAYTVYGRVSGGQDVPSGSYADTIVATVNF